MRKKIISIILILLGLVALGLGIGSGTIWKPETSVTLKTGTLDKSVLVATNPGVVHQVNDAVKIQVTDPKGGKVALVTGRSRDVVGWIGTDAHWQITGATTWDALDAKFVAGQEQPADPEQDPATEPEAPAEGEEAGPQESPAASLIDSDMWLDVYEGEGSISIDVEKVPDSVIFLAASLEPGATEAPQVSFTWDREVATPLVLPGILVGALLIAIGALLLIDSLRRTPNWVELDEQAKLAVAAKTKSADLKLAEPETDAADNTTELESEGTAKTLTEADRFGAGNIAALNPVVDPLVDSDTTAEAVTSSLHGSESRTESTDSTDSTPDLEELPGSDRERSAFAPPIPGLGQTDESNNANSDAGSQAQEPSSETDTAELAAAQSVAGAADNADASIAADQIELDKFAPTGTESAGSEQAEPIADQPAVDQTGAEQTGVLAANGAAASADDDQPDVALNFDPVNAPAQSPPKRSWLGQLFGKKRKNDQAAVAAGPIPLPADAIGSIHSGTGAVGDTPAPALEGAAEQGSPSAPIARPTPVAPGTPSANHAFAPVAPSANVTGEDQPQSQQAALEAFAAMDEPDVTTGALQAAGLTRRQLREMRERKEAAEQRNIPTTTGSLEFGAPVVDPGLQTASGSAQAEAPLERPSWLPQGADTTTASNWRAAWGVRKDLPEQPTQPVPVPPSQAGENSAPGQEPQTTAATSAQAVPGTSAPQPAATDQHNSTVAPAAPSTRRALYGAYRAAAEVIANQDADEEQPK
ncbi:hypothetical protein V5R04_02405 [Jonesiaceae bacterium BS-20]|uniref:Uncharacterized protein n=1 Tax=Jonesiaceae bacterium BS-20 TaxID=3120821 RepID=A0AAU7DW85_9MICO